jgi:hypothetical protein
VRKAGWTRSEESSIERNRTLMRNMKNDSIFEYIALVKQARHLNDACRERADRTIKDLRGQLRFK